MRNIIIEMIESANTHHDYELAERVYKLLSEFAMTINCPSDWLHLGEELRNEYNGNDWVMDNCRLYEF